MLNIKNKAAKRRNTSDKRSRKGCRTCKTRKVKCDENPKVCGNCQRLKLECSYEKVFQFGEEYLTNGLAFGRSNQHKKQKLQEEYKNVLKSTALDFETFKEVKSSSLSKIAFDSNTPWLKPENQKIHFINLNKEDFDEVLNDVVPTGGQLKSRIVVHTHPLLRLISSLLCKDINTGQTRIENPLDSYFDGYHEYTTPSTFTHNLSEISLTNFFETNLELNMDFNFFDPLSILSMEEKQLFHYFTNAICPNCICYPGETSNQNWDINLGTGNNVLNPYLHLIVPLGLQSLVVRNAIMATSAHQLFLLGNTEYEDISNKFSNQSVEQLTQLMKQNQYLNSFDWDEVLATVLMMCFKEISSTCDYRSTWMIYLNCAKQFINQFTTLKKNSPLCNFFARYFIVHEVMGETAWLERRKIDSTSFENKFDLSKVDFDIFLDDSIDTEQCLNKNFCFSLTNDSEEKDTSIDVVFGCCPYLITLIHKISSLGMSYEDLENEPIEVRRELEKYIIIERNKVEKEVNDLQQRIIISESIDLNSETYIMVIAEIKRLSTLVYLYARVDLETMYYKCHNIKYFQCEKIRDIKHKIMNLYRQLPKCPMSLIWPLFVFGLICADTDEERWFVLDKLMYLQSSRELGSVRTTKEVVLAVWKERDLHESTFRWKNMLRGRTESLSLA